MIERNPFCAALCRTAIAAAVLFPVHASCGEMPADDIGNKVDYLVFTPTVPRNIPREKMDPARRGDRYNDHFQVLWDEGRRRYYAFWTQASWEGAGDHHVMFSRSLDMGKTWSEAIVLAGSERRACRRFQADWQQPMLSKGGRLYCLWNQEVRTRKGGWPQRVLAGFYSDDGGDTWCPPDVANRPGTESKPWVMPLYTGWINWQRPLRLAPGGKYFVGSSESGTTRFWRFENIDDNPEICDISISAFPGAPKERLKVADVVDKIEYVSDDKRPAIEEASVVKLPDGRLFALMRSSTGHPLWSQSRDGGESWSAPRFLRDAEGKAYPHPRSPCPIYDWKGPEAGSGIYFSFVHNMFDFNNPKTPYQKRGPLYLIAGRFDPSGEQPIKFSPMKLFWSRGGSNAFYTSYTVADGTGVLWFPDTKYRLVGRKIGPEWFDDAGSIPAKPASR